MTKKILKSWIQTHSGHQFYPLDPNPLQITILDIAHALSNVCRYTGHVMRFYSVAEHSVIVSRYVPRELALWGLLHDAAEAYLVDVPSPIKGRLEGYAEIEERVEEAVCERFKLPWPMPYEVKRIDHAILADEQTQLMVNPPAPRWFPERPLGVVLECWPPERAKAEFLARYSALMVGSREQ